MLMKDLFPFWSYFPPFSQASREALSQVADKAEIEHLETKTHMRSMTYKLQAEKDHSTMADKKMHKILVS